MNANFENFAMFFESATALIKYLKENYHRCAPIDIQSGERRALSRSEMDHIHELLFDELSRDEIAANPASEAA